jgi:hypothetical protein
MTSREHTANTLRLRGCLLALHELDTDNAVAVRETLRRVRKTLAACQSTSDEALARDIIRRMKRLAQKVGQ